MYVSNLLLILSVASFSLLRQRSVSLPARVGQNGEARHPHSGPPPEAGAAVHGVGEAADPKAERRGAENG